MSAYVRATRLAVFLHPVLGPGAGERERLQHIAFDERRLREIDDPATACGCGF